MELKISSKVVGLSPPDCVSDPEEKEVSDEDDDDRNHKHRRKETRSQSSERDTLEPVFTGSYRKRNKPFVNGHSFRGNESQGSETWKNYNISPLDKDFTSKFDKRRSGMTSISRVNMDLNERIRSNQSFSGEPGRGRGRGRDSGSWSQRDRFSSADIASQMVPHGSINSGLFPGRGLPNAQNASWNGFGLMPAIPNGGLEALHPIGLQGTLRPAVHNPLNMGMIRQRCRDFEEQGFCLRGDMCPMEHGVNRIVVEDVQSLSQFNLPVSLPSAPLGPTTGPGALPSVNNPLMNSKSHSRSGKTGALVDDGMFNGGADLYDPDQPLWNHNGPESSNPLLSLHSFKDDETQSLHDGVDNETELGRIGTNKKREKTDLSVSTSDYLNTQVKEDQDALAHIRGSSQQEKRIFPEDTGPSLPESSAKAKSDTSRFTRKPSQKAQRTLFVCGIPQKSNRRDVLLSHFQKFGEVIDIYIPSNSDRAFVQFSKREEAEDALRAPDAVMGNRFIKLLWANRDNIPDDGINNSSTGVPFNKGKGNIVAPSSEGPLSSNDHPKVSAPNGLKPPPPLQKKVELEQLKEELRKKQELLAQKRKDFRRQLDKLEKHATVVKGEVLSEPAAKKPRVSIASDAAKVTTPRPFTSNPATNLQSRHSETVVDENMSTENVVLSSPKTKTLTAQQDSTGLKQPIRPGTPFQMNRYKLDNRPTAFRVMPPLPLDLANGDALKEHFSSHGDIFSVELEEIESTDDSYEPKKCTALVTFATRHSAERAFSNGKIWQGNKLQFMWVTSSTEPSASKRLVDTDSQTAEKSHQTDSLEACASKNEELEIPERNCDVFESKKDSPKFEGAISEEKESSTDNAC